MQEKIHIEQVRPGVNKITVYWPAGKQDLWLAPLRAGTIRREKCNPYCLHPMTGLPETDLSQITRLLPQNSHWNTVVSSIYKNKPAKGWFPLSRAGLEGDTIAIGTDRVVLPDTLTTGTEYYFIGSRSGKPAAARGCPSPQGDAQILSDGQPLEGDFWFSGVPVVWDGKPLGDNDYLHLAEAGILSDITDWLLLPRLTGFGFLGVDQIATKGVFPWQFSAQFKQALKDQTPLVLLAKVDGESIRKGEELFSALNKALRRDFQKQKHQGEVTEPGHVYVRRLDEIHLFITGRPRPRLITGLNGDGNLISLAFSGTETDGASRGITLAEAAHAAADLGMTHAVQTAAGSGIRLALGDTQLELGGPHPAAVAGAVYWK